MGRHKGDGGTTSCLKSEESTSSGDISPGSDLTLGPGSTIDKVFGQDSPSPKSGEGGATSGVDGGSQCKRFGAMALDSVPLYSTGTMLACWDIVAPNEFGVPTSLQHETNASWVSVG